MLGAQLESREVYVDLERKMELEKQIQEREAERDREFMCFMGQMGQMMSMFFAQSMGTSFPQNLPPPGPQAMYPQPAYPQPTYPQPAYPQPLYQQPPIQQPQPPNIQLTHAQLQPYSPTPPRAADSHNEDDD